MKARWSEGPKDEKQSGVGSFRVMITSSPKRQGVTTTVATLAWQRGGGEGKARGGRGR